MVHQIIEILIQIMMELQIEMKAIETHLLEPLHKQPLMLLSDTDGDGLMNVFDNNNIASLTAGNYYKNVTMGNMGAGGGFDGPTPTGSLIGLQKSDAAGDRDWRNLSILPLNIVAFSVNHQSPIATLNWKVENELSTNYYEVEFSTNGTQFQKIATVLANNAGTSNYLYNHNLNQYF
ncbi:MAG: hypothetical protein V9E96_11890 [Chitinophagaceae bacterium]